MVDVFISYSRSDRDAVAQLAQAVTAAGYDVWWDKELPPHKSYGDVIAEKISEAAATIVVWSQDAVKSEWVRAEADFAREQKKLIQTALDETMPPMPFNQIQYAQLGDWRGEEQHGGWSKVRASLAELCGARHPEVAPPSPLPPPRPAAATTTASRWPLWAGGGMLALAAALVAAVQLRAPAAAPPTATAPLSQPAPALAPAVPVQPAPAIAMAEPPLAAAPSVAAAPRAAPAAHAAPVVATMPSAGGTVSNPVPVAAVNPAPVPEADAAPKTSTSKAPHQVFPLSSVRALNARQLSGLSPEQLQLARNEIFAHAGRRFRDSKLVMYFSQYNWYRPQAFEVTLNSYETQNVKLLDAAIEAQK